MFCDFILVILTLTVNWMLPQDHYNLDICVMSSPSMVQVPYCWLSQTHEQSNRSVCNKYWHAAPEIGKTVRILACSICMRFKICHGMTLLMDEWFLIFWTKCLHLQHSSSSITIFFCNVRNHSPKWHSVTSHKTWISATPPWESHIWHSIVLSKKVHICLCTTPQHIHNLQTNEMASMGGDIQDNGTCSMNGTYRTVRHIAQMGHTRYCHMRQTWDIQHNWTCSTNGRTILKQTLKKEGVKVQNGDIWLTLQVLSELFRTQQWTFTFHKTHLGCQ